MHEMVLFIPFRRSVPFRILYRPIVVQSAFTGIRQRRYIEQYIVSTTHIKKRNLLQYNQCSEKSPQL